ncbi:MAG: hypothetical protein JKY54_07135 [Flavobacteriales bacterium]|nr:hypothetical protein [Flavobacteriales bacterium]
MKRPTVNESMVRKAAECITEVIDGRAEDIVSEYAHPMDGYDLAKALNSNRYWDATREDMEALDEVESIVSELLRQAEKVWFDVNDIQPPLEIGTMTALGEITGVNEYSIARYEIKEPGQDDSQTVTRLIVNFEDVVAISECDLKD